ncbi:MAG TPA: hypothetical protein PKC19_17015 [Roseiflexaceae bacterium]|nr:hypothetical protein [Roseiflexaceae bacterium]
MTTTYEAAVTVVEQLSPVDQARLVVLLAERLQQTLQTEPSPAEGDEPAFWHLPVDDAKQLGSETPRFAVRQSAVPAQAETQAMVMRWFGRPLPEEDALELAMSASIAEWNLDE